MKVRPLAVAGVALAAALVAGGLPRAAPPDAVIVTGDAWATTSEVHVGRARAMVRHAPGAVIRGDVLAPDVAVVVADETTGDYGAALFRVDGAGARVLARGVYHASRPLASRDGRVYVERGAAGPPPQPGRLRTDDIAIDAVDPDTGAARTLYAWSGYTLHIAGELGAEILVYRVAFEGADLVALDRTSGRMRLLTALLPYARDFSVDPARGALVMSNRDASDAHAWVVERVALATGARERLFQSRDRAPIPRTTANGEVVWGSPPASERLDEALR